MTDDGEFALQAAAAFAHEIRSPLTSLAMALDLGRAGVPEGEVRLDAGLAAMVRSSVESLNELADAFQLSSRLDRGKVEFAPTPATLQALIAAAEASLPSPVRLAGGPVPAADGAWDVDLLGPALAGIATGVYRAGDGDGVVQVEYGLAGGRCELAFQSGPRGDALRPPGPEAGYSFFVGRQLLLAAGAGVVAGCGEGSMRVEVSLPL